MKKLLCIHVPRGLANCGMKIVEQHRTILNINVFTQPTKEACYIEHTYYPLPEDENVKILNGTERHYVSSERRARAGLRAERRKTHGTVR